MELSVFGPTTLSALRTNLPLRLAAIKMKRVISISSPGPHKSMLLLTTSLLMPS
jgi:hypothetical protein